jgi:hypothetical protein
MLKGTVVLCLPNALKVEDVHLRVMGQLKVGWNDQKITPTGISNNRVERTTEIFSHRWPPFVGGPGGSNSRGTTLPAGNYEWPFELVIPGKLAESIEGLEDSHIIYKLKATVARGKLAYDLHTFKPLRIVRTLDPSALELAHAMTVENVWPNKIEYQLIIPQKAIIFGTAIDVEMRFTSLLKGLRIGTIKCQLIEAQEFTIPGATTHTERFWKHTREVDTWQFELNEEEHYQDILNENGQDGYVMKQRMPLPKTLRKCIQDADTNGIKIRHKVKFNVALHNPDGHVSELRATLPVTIFISPNMPLNPEGLLVDQTPMNTESVDIGEHAPPLYEHHQLDQLYADVIQSGIMTPHPQSGMNTPFYAQSRAGSHENLASLNGGGVNSNGAVPPAALSTRLQNLNNGVARANSYHALNHQSGSGSTTPHHYHHQSESGYFDARNHSGEVSGNSSMPLSRRTSEEDNNRTSNLVSGNQTPEHIDFSDLGDLTKVPSYRTAVKTPLRSLSYTEALPNYETAVSAPPSPTRGVTTPGINAETIRGFSGHQMSSLGFTPIHPPPPVHMPANIGDGDERRRLHVLQTRGRAH